MDQQLIYNKQVQHITTAQREEEKRLDSFQVIQCYSTYMSPLLRGCLLKVGHPCTTQRALAELRWCSSCSWLVLRSIWRRTMALASDFEIRRWSFLRRDGRWNHCLSYVNLIEFVYSRIPCQKKAMSHVSIRFNSYPLPPFCQSISEHGSRFCLGFAIFAILGNHKILFKTNSLTKQPKIPKEFRSARCFPGQIASA